MQKLVAETKIALQRKDIVDLETHVLRLLDWKIPNFSVRHFLESLLCVGVATSSDQV